MAILIDVADIPKIKKARSRRAPLAKPGAKEERVLAKGLQRLWSEILAPAAQRIRDLVKAGAPAQEIADVMSRVFNEATQQYGMKANDLLWRWSMDLDDATKRAMIGSLSKTLGVDIKGLYDTPAIKDAMSLGAQQAAGLITSIPQRYLGQVSESVIRAFRGEGQPGGRSLLEQIDIIGGVGRRHARLIARDQTNKMVAVLTQTRQTSIGIEEYIWRTAGDQRVVGNPSGKYPDGNAKHMDHYHRAGKIFRWDSPPPDGHPGSGIQCLPGSTIIDFSDGCHKLWRRFFSGYMVHVTSGDGGNLEATPNHPVMTHRGLLPIDEIKEGDYLINRFCNTGSISETNDGEFVSSFKDVFDTCYHSIGSTVRSGTEFDFHGDGTEHQVDTVDVKGFLANYIVTIADQCHKEFMLSGSISSTTMQSILLDIDCDFPGTVEPFFSRKISSHFVSLENLVDSLLLGHFRKSDIHTLRSIAYWKSMFLEDSRNDESVNIVSQCDGFNAFSRHVGFNNPVFRKIIASIMRNPIISFDGNPSLSEVIAQIVGVTSHLDGHVFQCGSRLYQFSRVVQKTICKFSDHVYNLQSSSGLYIANNYVIGNCRCWAQPILDTKKILEHARTV
jgi:hypothetical protein